MKNEWAIAPRGKDILTFDLSLTNHYLLAIWKQVLNTNYQALIINYRLFFIGYWLLVVG